MGRKVKSYTQEYNNTITDLFNSGKTYAEIVRVDMKCQKQL